MTSVHWWIAGQQCPKQTHHFAVSFAWAPARKPWSSRFGDRASDFAVLGNSPGRHSRRDCAFFGVSCSC